MARKRQRRRPMSEINVVPYIDVMLVLLVIFMITAPLLTQGVKVDVPSADAKPLEGEATDVLVLAVNSAGDFFLEYGDEPEKPIAHQRLISLVAGIMRHAPDTPVMVRGDKNASYGQVVAAMALLQKAGVPSIGLITEPPEQTQ